MSHSVKFFARNLPMHFPKTEAEIAKAIEELAVEPELTVDTETTGLYWYEETFRCFYVTFCDGKRGVGFQFPKNGSRTWKFMKTKIFENPLQYHVYQNAKFDLLGIRKHGIEDLGQVHDTMILKALHDERDAKHLDKMAVQYLEAGEIACPGCEGKGNRKGENVCSACKGNRVVKEQVKKYNESIENWFKENGIKKDERRYDKVPMELMGPYAVQDVIVTWWLWKGLYKEIQSNEHWKKCYEVVELPCLRCLVDVESTGYAMDTKMLKSLEPELEAQTIGLESEMRKLVLRVAPQNVGRNEKDVEPQIDGQAWADEFNFQSPDQLANLFLNQFKIPRNTLGTTETGKPSCDKYALERIKALSKDPTSPYAAAINLAAILSEFSEKKTLLDTFVKGIDKRAVGGFLYGQFNQVGARTGRMSSSNPNMQNMPVEGPIRKGFVCRPGMMNFFFDWKQIEMAILAHYCEDETMLEALHNGEDLHKATAAVLFDKKVEDVQKDERTIAKTINFAIVYGAGQKRVAEQIGWELQRAKELLVKYNAKFPGVRDFRERASRVARQRGYVKTFWGRYRHIEAGKDYIAVNSIIQGTATGDLTKIGLARVRGILNGKPAAVISVVHDEYHVQIKKGHEQELVPKIKSVLEDFPEFRVPVVAEVSYTETNWGDKKPWPPQDI